MIKLFVVLALIGMVFAFTGCDKPKVSTEKAIAIEQQIYAQDDTKPVPAKETKVEVKQEAAIKEESNSTAKTKAVKKKKAKKTAKVKAQQKKASAEATGTQDKTAKVVEPVKK